MLGLVKRYFYKLLYSYISVYIRPNDTLVEIDPVGVTEFMPENTAVYCHSNEMSGEYDSFKNIGSLKEIREDSPDYLLMNGNIHYERDLYHFLKQMHTACNSSTRLIITYYSKLWHPLFRFASYLNLRK